MLPSHRLYRRTLFCTSKRTTHNMPPQRTVPPAKALKTERTHEENQERYAMIPLIILPTCSHYHTVPISQRLGEATGVLRLESSQQDELRRYISDALVAHYESPNRMSSMRRCMRRKMMTYPCSTDDLRPTFRPAQPTSTDAYPPILRTTLP